MNRYTIRKQFTFSASHQLSGLPADHPCARLHGHNYTVEVELVSSTLDATGFVVDYNNLRVFGNWLDATFDHMHLNYVVPFNPTAELLADHFLNWARDRWPQVVAVTVCETPKTSARCEVAH